MTYLDKLNTIQTCSFQQPVLGYLEAWGYRYCSLNFCLHQPTLQGKPSPRTALSLGPTYVPSVTKPRARVVRTAL